jgi:hypothetical protein
MLSASNALAILFLLRNLSIEVDGGDLGIAGTTKPDNISQCSHSSLSLLSAPFKHHLLYIAFRLSPIKPLLVPFWQAFEGFAGSRLRTVISRLLPFSTLGSLGRLCPRTPNFSFFASTTLITPPLL